MALFGRERALTRLAFVVSFGVVLMGAAPLEAQVHRSSVGMNFGAVMYSSFNSGASVDYSLRPSPPIGIFVGAQYDSYFGSGRAGYRLAAGLQPLRLWWVDQNYTIPMWSGDFDLLIRPILPEPDTRTIPYLSAGIGITGFNAKWDDPEGFPAAGAAHPGGNSSHFSLLFGVGVDFLMGEDESGGPSFLIRAELQDNYMTSSPFVKPIGGEAFGGVHNLRLSIGFHNTMGRIL